MKLNQWDLNRIRHKETGKIISKIKHGEIKKGEAHKVYFKPWEDPERVKYLKEKYDKILSTKQQIKKIP